MRRADAHKPGKLGLSSKANKCSDTGTGNLGALTTYEISPRLSLVVKAPSSTCSNQPVPARIWVFDIYTTLRAAKILTFVQNFGYGEREVRGRMRRLGFCFFVKPDAIFKRGLWIINKPSGRGFFLWRKRRALSHFKARRFDCNNCKKGLLIRVKSSYVGIGLADELSIYKLGEHSVVRKSWVWLSKKCICIT